MIASVALLGTIVLVGTAPDSPANDDGSAKRVALVPLLGVGLAADEVTRDETLIRREVDAHFGAKSVPGSDVHARLDQAASVGLQCDRADVACLVQLGVVCQADVVLLPVLDGSKSGGASAGITFALRLVDVGDAQQAAYAQTTLGGPLRPEDVSALIARLEQPDAKKIAVDVTGPVGAKVVVDGTEVAKLPLTSALTDVKPGKHEVRVVSDEIFIAPIDVRAGEPVVVHAPVKPSFPVPWVAGGAVVAAAGVAAVIVGVVPYFQYAGASSKLTSLQTLVGADASKAKANAAAIKAASADLASAKNAWESYSGPAMIGGTVAIVAGAAIIAVPFVLE